MSDGCQTFEITRLAKRDGPLTKRISLADDGSTKSDGSACVMSRGTAGRVQLDNLGAFGSLIHSLEPHQAVALGALRADLPDAVSITTQDHLAKLNGTVPAGVIARDADHIFYRPDRPALVLLDYDTKGMPRSVKAALDQCKGYLPALMRVMPELEAVARVTRPSTSAGLYRADTGEVLPGSNGLHVFVLVKDGSDAERFLKTLHERCWLDGFGWMMVGAGGQLLDRSIVDRMVGRGERLVFEGAPVLDAPLAQDKDSRTPVVVDGELLDTSAACVPLTIVERARLKELHAKEATRLAPARAKERERFIKEHAERIATRTNIALPAARHIVERQCDGVLLPNVVLPWDDDTFAGCTVADILASPDRFAGATMADPLEGVDYGRAKAMVMRRADGTPWIHSFAHGRVVYELRYDAVAARAAISAVPPDEIADAFVRIAVHADLDADQKEALRNHVADVAGIGKRTLDAKLRAAKKTHTDRLAVEARDRAAAGRQDTRPQIPAPASDAPWLPQMGVLNEVLGGSTAQEPPMRDIDGVITQVRVRRVPNMHLLTSGGVNDGESNDARQAATEQPLLTRLDETRLAELIEQHIDYVDEAGRSVHLAAPFVKHFHTRADDALPTVSAIATLPLVLPDGTLLAKRGLDRQRGIIFRVPPALLALMPAPEECTPAAVAAAMRFLVDDWLCDVSAGYAGKCILIAAALTVIERSALPERPAFFVTAGRRGGGKTTALIMLLVAVTGIRPSAAAWSPNEEERRKALLSYLLEALPAVIWDNIPRGSQISCPHIEKSCTTAFYSDRRLGVSEMVAVSAAVIHLFTGNNIAPRGDLASRSLQVRLELDRPDPENREFKHPDPVGWTEANRGEILRALYTILLGNPALKPGSNATPQTRFKAWWRLVGSAVENAASVHAIETPERAAAMVDDHPACPPVAINFRDLFLSQEEDDEETASLADALAALDAIEWPRDKGPKETGPFQAADLARVLNDQSEYRVDAEKERAATLREFLFPNLPTGQIITPKAAGKRLKRHHGEPVKAGKQTLCLKVTTDSHSNAAKFWVESKGK